MEREIIFIAKLRPTKLQNFTENKMFKYLL